MASNKHKRLASYSDSSWNNLMESLDYGNGDSVDYTYGQQGKATNQTYGDADNVSY